MLISGMSSHHIVRDEQEPALLVLNASLLQEDRLANLLEWSPTIVVPVQQLEELSLLGIKPDVIIVSPAEAKTIMKEWEHFTPLNILEKEETVSDIAAAMQFLESQHHKAVNILGAPSPADLEAVSPFRPRLDIVFYSEKTRWIWMRNGHYNKWHPAGTKLIVHASAALDGFRLGGFSELRDQDTGPPFVLETLGDRIVTIETDKGFLLEEPF